MFNVHSGDIKSMEEILQDEFSGISDAKVIEEALRAIGWRRHRDHTQLITQNQVRRGLRNNSR